MAVDKFFFFFFFSLGLLTFATHHKQLCAVRYVLLYPSHRNASTPKHPLVYGFAG